MAIRDFGDFSFNFTSFVLLSLHTLLDTSCLLLLLSNPRNPMVLAKHSQNHCCDVMGFKAYPYSPIRFSMLTHLTYYLGIGIRGIRGYDNTNNWNSSVVNESGMVGSDPITYVTCCHHVTLQ